MDVDREELKRVVDRLPEEKLAILQRYLRMLQKSSLLEGKAIAPTEQGDPILRVLGCLSGEPLTAWQIEEELYGGNPPDA